jgi:hypothetical protein
MKTYLASLVASVLATFLIVTTVQAKPLCEPAQFSPDQYQVAIDRATGITLIQSPCGWEFVGVSERSAIEENIRLANAQPVPADVLAAQMVLQPQLRQAVLALAAQ